MPHEERLVPQHHAPARDGRGAQGALQAQAALYMKNGPAFTSGYYVNHGLVFAKERRDEQRPQDRIGQPIATLGGVRFHRLIVKAGVKRIRFHGCRHCVATLLL
jgi:hypothetical protein